MHNIDVVKFKRLDKERTLEYKEIHLVVEMMMKDGDFFSSETFCLRGTHFKLMNNIHLHKIIFFLQ